MMVKNEPAETAFHIADRLKIEGPWDVFAERARRYELHFNGRQIEMVRGPIELEGYGLRVFRYHDGKTRVGFLATTDLSEHGVSETAREATALGEYSTFPAGRVALPPPGQRHPSVEIVDPRLWEDPAGTLQAYVDSLFHAFDGRREVAPSFGSVRATLTETSIANSEGLRVGYPHTTVEFEVAVKSFGGPEGAPPGEYWVNETSRRVTTATLAQRVDDWCRYARDVRRASPSPSGELPVVLPAPILSQILPMVIGARFTGWARLRQIAPEIGTPWGNESLDLLDNGLVPWGIASAPMDDEGTPQRSRQLLRQGRVAGILYDALHGAAFGTPSTGNSVRGIGITGYRDWRRFTGAPNDTSSTLEVRPGAGGTDTELIEAAHDGIWVQQLGWAVPDPISGAFGGELRIGYRIRGGKLAEPIRGGTVGGVVMAPPGAPSLLANLAAIGSHAELSESVLAPSVLVRPLTVAGGQG